MSNKINVEFRGALKTTRYLLDIINIKNHLYQYYFQFH